MGLNCRLFRFTGRGLLELKPSIILLEMQISLEGGSTDSKILMAKKMAIWNASNGLEMTRKRNRAPILIHQILVPVQAFRRSLMRDMNGLSRTIHSPTVSTPVLHRAMVAVESVVTIRVERSLQPLSLVSLVEAPLTATISWHRHCKQNTLKVTCGLSNIAVKRLKIRLGASDTLTGDHLKAVRNTSRLSGVSSVCYGELVFLLLLPFVFSTNLVVKTLLGDGERGT